MPGPDPYGIEYGPDWPHRPNLLVYRTYANYLGGGNNKHRKDRAKRILKKMASWRGWRCQWCGDDVPIYRRADAVFCSEGCRKRAARKLRGSLGQINDGAVMTNTK